MTDIMRERGAVVRAAAQALQQGGLKLELIPALVLRIINERMWEERAIPEEGWRPSPRFASFEEFVTTGPWEGMGTSIATLKDVCRRDVRAVDAIDRATLREPCNNVPGLTVAPAGNAQAKALRRLRKDRPDLHVLVLAGELTAHGAMRQAGFRPKTITVRPSDPESVARSLHKHMAARDLAALAQLLAEYGGP